MWQQARNFGVVVIDGSTKVKVYKDSYNFFTIETRQPIKTALWGGDFLNIYLANGRVRRYRDWVNFDEFGG